MPTLNFEYEHHSFKFCYETYIKEIRNNPEKAKLVRARESKNLGLNFEGYEIDI